MQPRTRTDVTTPIAEMPRLLNEREAAERLGVSVKTLQNWRWKGIGPRYRKLNALVRYALEDLLEFVGESRQ